VNQLDGSFDLRGWSQAEAAVKPEETWAMSGRLGLIPARSRMRAAHLKWKRWRQTQPANSASGDLGCNNPGVTIE